MRTFYPSSTPSEITMPTFRRKALENFQAIAIRRLYFPR